MTACPSTELLSLLLEIIAIKKKKISCQFDQLAINLARLFHCKQGVKMSRNADRLVSTTRR